MDTQLPTQSLLKLLQQPVWILTRNQREYSGILSGVDEYTNVILQDCIEFEKLQDNNFKQTKHKLLLLNGSTIDMIIKGEKPHIN